MESCELPPDAMDDDPVAAAAGGEADVGVPVLATDTIMKTRDDRLRLAQATLAFAAGRDA